MNQYTNPNFCPVCDTPAPKKIGTRIGKFRVGFEFQYYQCDACWFAFIGNPWTDYASIYTDQYYEGKGADPLADYRFELEHPEETIRIDEWEGLLKIVRKLFDNDLPALWLDYGCGNGGLVQHVNQVRGNLCLGFDEGNISESARKKGVPIVSRSQLEGMQGQFDLITAIEVVEHVPDPISFLRSIRTLLKPGGVFFLTTGNSRSNRGRIHQWSYASIPEVHISFFEPETLAFALSRCGFSPVFRGYLPGYDQVIKFKVLKNLKIQKRSPVLNALPWSIISRLVNRIYGVSAHPIGIAI